MQQERMIVSIEGDESNLREAFRKSRAEVEAFHASAVRTLSKPTRMVIDIDTGRVKRDVSEIDSIMARAYSRWGKQPPGSPTPLQLGFMGATGNYKDVPTAADMKRMSGNSSGLVQDMVGLRSGLPEKTGAETAKALITGLRNQFRSSVADAREELFRGLINQQEFEARSRQAAQAMNRGILSGIERIGDSGKMTGALHAKLVNELQMAGLAGADAMTSAMKARMQARGAELAGITAANMRRAMNVSAPDMGGSGKLAGIGANAAFGAMFAIEGITRAQGKAEKAAVGFRSALQTVAIAASTKGPYGIAIAAAALGLTFLVDKFAGASKAAREFKAELAGMVNAGDSLGLQRQLQTLEFGSPADGAGLGGGFAGSIRDLEAQRTQAAATMRANDGTDGRAWNLRVYNQEKRRVEELTAMLTPLYDKQATLREAILNPVAPLRAPSGLPAVSVTANTPERQAREDMQRAREEMEALRSHVGTLTTAWEQLNKPGERTVGLMQQVVAAYDRLGTMLASVNPFSEQANTIRAMRADLEKIERIQLMNNANPFTADRIQVMSATRARPEWAQNVLQTPIVTPAGTGGIAQQGPQGTVDGPIRAAIMKDFEGIGPAVGGMLMQAFGPIAAVMEILRPAIEVVAPLFSALMAPLAAVGQVLATLIEPVFRLMFPIIKAVAIGLSYLGEMIARVVAGIAQAVGGLLVGIGNLLNKLPGSIGNPIKRLGQSVLNFANGVKASANKMAETRRELQSMEFGQTASDITGLGHAARDTAEALSNVPELFKLTLAQLRHFGIETVYGQQNQVPPVASSMSGMSIGEVTIILPDSTSNPRETAKAVVQELEQVGMAYGMGTPWSAVPSTAL